MDEELKIYFEKILTKNKNLNELKRNAKLQIQPSIRLNCENNTKLSKGVLKVMTMNRMNMLKSLNKNKRITFFENKDESSENVFLKNQKKNLFQNKLLENINQHSQSNKTFIDSEDNDDNDIIRNI